MSVSVPENLEANVTSLSAITLTWDKAVSPDVGMLHYKIYRDGTLLDLIDYDVQTYIDSSITLNTTYSYQVTAIDRNHNESSLSTAVSIEFSHDNFILHDLENYLLTQGAQNMELIVNQSEYPILTAVRDYSYDVGQAIDNPVRFDREYRTSIDDNMTSFFYIPMDDLINYGFSADQTIKNRRFFTSPIVFQKLTNIFRKIITVAERFAINSQNNE